ncbi:MAG: Type IV pilus assembly protein PilM [Thermacetogenium phaeum]|uniref:Type IV pilus assembly protein PilM n=1 Tax=Thermacetogenium phaeum TaxID=85874 RepID=A0A124FKA0_9THEO|nr:MAG: Type IV pilus assembly protein PilM [Thermacetogenium phaeum]
MKDYFQKYLPKKTNFIGVDVGTSTIKAAEVQIDDGVPIVTSLKFIPSPKGVWADEVDEEKLVESLRELRDFSLNDVITCIGGEKVISRILRFPRMSDKELEAAVRFEVEKFVPTPLEQLIIRYVRLGEAAEGQEPIVNVLLFVVPAATVYQYYGIFSRAGLTVTAVDAQVFALWRLFGREVEGTVAIADIGMSTSYLVIVRDGEIRFARLLPVGGNILTKSVMVAFGVEFAEAERMKGEAGVMPVNSGGAPSEGWEQFADLEAAVAVTNDRFPEGMRLDYVLRDGLAEITRELQRSLEFYVAQERVGVERLLLSGGTGKLRGVTDYLSGALQIPVELGFPDIEMAEGVAFDPSFSVAIGLALREVYA